LLRGRLPDRRLSQPTAGQTFASQATTGQFAPQPTVGQSPAQQTQGGQAFVQARQGAGLQARAVRTRRRWPLVVAVCAAVLLFTVASAWLAFRLLRRPSVAEDRKSVG